MFQVQQKMCDECLFTEKRIVSDERAEKVVEDCLQSNTFFNCHKAQLNGLKNDLCCRGFWDYYKDQFNLGRIAQRLNAVKFVEVK